VKVAANFAQLLRNKFNAIKHRSTRLNFGRLCRWNHPPNHIKDKRKEAAKSKKLVKARATPCQNTVFAARQNLAECCAKCFVCANRPLPTVVLRMMLRMVPTALRTLLLRLLPRVITTLLPRRCPAAANCAANPIAKPVQPCC
jgi:hypothetical protein